MAIGTYPISFRPISGDPLRWILENARGGVVGAGSALTSDQDAPITASGGAVLAGTAKVGVRAATIFGSGGVWLSGQEIDNQAFAILGSGGAVCAGQSVLRISAGQCTGDILCDTFTDDDGTFLANHVMDSNTMWTCDGSWTIEGFQALCSDTSQAVSNAGQTDYYIQTDFTLMNGAKVGLVVRFQDANNYWLVSVESSGAFRIIENNAGFLSQRAFTTLPLLPLNTPNTLQVLVKGALIIATLDGSDLSYIPTTYLTAQFVGLANDATNGGNLGSFDNFFASQAAHNITAVGGSVCAGTASVQVSYAVIGAGGELAGGSAIQFSPFFETGSGGVLCGGSALNRYTNTGSGGVWTAGTALDPVTYNSQATGGAVCSGVASINIIANPAASGGAWVNGVASVKASNEGQGGDQLRLWLTGASTYRGDQEASNNALGDFHSDSEAIRMGWFEARAIKNLVILTASRACGLGVGSIAVVGTKVAFAAPNGQLGTAQLVNVGFPQVLSDGLNPSAWVKVLRTTSDELVGATAVEFVEGFNNLFGMDNSVYTGSDTYRCAMFSNDGLGTLTNISVWLNPLATSVTCQGGLDGSNPGTIFGPDNAFNSWPFEGTVRIDDSGGAIKEIVWFNSRTSCTLNVTARGMLGTFATSGSAGDILTPIPPIAIGKELANPLFLGNVQTIANENTPPTAVTFSTPIVSTDGVQVASLNPNEQFGLWMHRQIPSGALATPLVLNSIAYSFTDANAVTYSDLANGQFRVFNTGLQRYEFFVGQDIIPDITGTPEETFSALPHTTTYNFAPSHTYNYVTNFRNQFNMTSEPVSFGQLSLDGSGNPVLPKPNAPVSATIVAVASGAFRIVAQYYYQGDPSPADNFRLYISYDGSNPLLETPVDVPVVNVLGVYHLDFTTSVQTVPTTAKAVVRTYRSSDGQESTNVNVVSATSVSTDFGEARVKALWRQVAEQLS